MRIFVLIPVYNRISHTRNVIKALKKQTLFQNLQIVVINDGSTDGTGEFLATQPDVTELKGDGSLWWGGAIYLGIKHIENLWQNGDYILFLNNDTDFAPDYVEALVRTSKENNNAAIGSSIHEHDKSPPLVSIGPKIDIFRMRTWDLLSELPAEEKVNPKAIYKVDTLSGRGSLYPVELFQKYGQMKPNLLPHYFADYEIAMRFARNKTPLLVSTEAIIYSPAVYGNDVSGMNWFERLFSQKSASNIKSKLTFYAMVGSPLQRLTAPLRLVIFATLRATKQMRHNRRKQA